MPALFQNNNPSTKCEPADECTLIPLRLIERMSEKLMVCTKDFPPNSHSINLSAIAFGGTV